MDYLIPITIAVVGSSGLWGFLQFILSRKQEKNKEQIDEILHIVSELKEKLDRNTELTLSVSRDKVNFLCNKYLELGYIPKEEVDSFLEMGEAYIKVGNSSVKDKFIKCKKELNIK